MTDSFFDEDKTDFDTPEVIFSNDNVPEVLQSYRVRVDKVFKAISDLEVNSEHSCRIALDASSDIKHLMKDMIYDKTKACMPYKEVINKINESCKGFTDKLDYVQEVIKEKINSYEQNMKILLEVAQKSNEITFPTEDSDLGLIPLNQPKIASTAKTIVSHKIDKDFTVINKALVPLDYLMIDEKKVKQAIKLGIFNIPGISIVETSKLVLRSR